MVDTAEELVALRRAVMGICSEFGSAYYVERAEAHLPTAELWQALGKHGFIGVNMPEEYGGGGGGQTELAVVCEASAAAGTPLLLSLASSAISAELIAEFGTPEQKKQWLPGMATGESKVIFAITEPDAGTNSLRVSTTATPDGDGYVLRGQKYYISGVNEADAIVVVAKTGQRPNGRAELSLFIVDIDTPGFVAQPLPVAVPLPERQFTVHFDDVRVGSDRLLGVEGKGFSQVFSGLNPERICVAAMCVGIGRYVLDRAADYAKARVVFADPIGAYQGVAHPLAEAKVQIELAALMTAEAARKHDAGEPAGEASNIAKFAAAEAVRLAVDAAIQCHGGNGLASEFGFVPYWGIARLFRVAPINREMLLNYIAEHSLSLPRSY